MTEKGRNDADEGIQSEGRTMLRGWFDGTLDGTKRPHSALADLLEVSKPAVGYWLRGTSRPEMHYRVAIEAICGIPVSAWELESERAKLKEALKRFARGRAEETGEDAESDEAVDDAEPVEELASLSEQLADAVSDEESSTTKPGPDLVNPKHAPSSSPPPGDEKPASVRVPHHSKPVPTPDPEGAI